jgi:hypothetical protein
VDVTLVHYSDRNIANSRFTAGEMERVYGLAADGVACPGIDFAAFAGQIAERSRQSSPLPG